MRINSFFRKIFKKDSKSKILKVFGIGFAMGSADIVPGVSGGTIAFIMGIYEELIVSIKTVTGKSVKLVIRGKVKEAINETPLTFLVPLALGILTAIFTLSKILETLLETQPVFVWSFFFGLVLASAILIGKRIKKWDVKLIGFLTAAAIGAYALVGTVPTQTPETPLAFLLAGAIAICAMILPGISGSFLLVIMGKYEQILNAVNTRDILTLGLVAVGAIIGLATFSRVLSWLFKKYHNEVIASLTGLMVGSLRKVWPWKETIKEIADGHSNLVLERNVLPESFTPEVLFSLMLFVAGVTIINYLQKVQVTKAHSDDIDQKELRKEVKETIKGSS